jgi:putative DNA methylase
MNTVRKKLIEVALPLVAINEGSKPETENPFLKGHPRAIHNWWARTPLSVSRAILFAQLIDDPGNDFPPAQAKVKREHLMDFVARLATWEATTDEELIAKARKMILTQFKGKMPEFWDMFAGRASIPLEAQRLGLKVTSSDLNPVAVTIQRALLEFPQKFKGRPPVNPKDSGKLVCRTAWRGSSPMFVSRPRRVT